MVGHPRWPLGARVNTRLESAYAANSGGGFHRLAKSSARGFRQAVTLRSATSSLLTGTPRVTLTRITASNGFRCPV